jgi:hypothetical protein
VPQRRRGVDHRRSRVQRKYSSRTIRSIFSCSESATAKGIASSPAKFGNQRKINEGSMPGENLALVEFGRAFAGHLRSPPARTKDMPD